MNNLHGGLGYQVNLHFQVHYHILLDDFVISGSITRRFVLLSKSHDNLVHILTSTTKFALPLSDSINQDLMPQTYLNFSSSQFSILSGALLHSLTWRRTANLLFDFCTQFGVIEMNLQVFIMS